MKDKEKTMMLLEIGFVIDQPVLVTRRNKQRNGILKIFFQSSLLTKSH